MGEYLVWKEKIISDWSDSASNSLYEQGFLLTRTGKGAAIQTRSVRIDLAKFDLNSENRRVLRKVEQIALQAHPLPYAEYHWPIGKMAKDFYEYKFGSGTFSAQKIKELLTDLEKSNFNRLLTYSIPPSQGGQGDVLGYCIALETDELLHYSYPFYDLPSAEYSNNPSLGLGMMLQAIVWAKQQGKKYFYLGSAQRPTDTYKLQFAGLEWFDGERWRVDLEELKKNL